MSASRPRAARRRHAELDEVHEWRCRRLAEAGFTSALAEQVSAEPRFDLHALLQLVDRGCPPELAVRILAPLPPEVAP